jgi:prepilin-type N-terminal cleavage/methylation domain-containing protein
MKKKRGFTLIELLAVIVILAIIALIATPIIMNIIDRSKGGVYDRQRDMVAKSAELYYFKYNDELVWEGDTTYVEVGRLKETGYLRGKILNPLNNQEIPDETKVLIYKENGIVNYSLQLYDNDSFKWYQQKMVASAKSMNVTLPTEIGETTMLDLNLLIDEEKVAEIRIPTDLTNRCVGYVEIEKVGADSYGYNAYVDCLLDASTFASHYVSYGGKYLDEFNDVKETSDGGYIAVGKSNSEVITKYGTGNNGGFDAIIVKFDNQGNVLWSKNYGGSNEDSFNSVVETVDGYIAVGTTASSDGDIVDYKGGPSDAVIVKYNKQGEVIINKVFGSSNNNYETFIKVINQENKIVVVGHILSSTFDGDVASLVRPAVPGSLDAIIMSYDLNLNIIDHHIFSGASADAYQSLLASADSNYIVVGNSASVNGDMAGTTCPSNFNYIGIIVKYNSSLDILTKNTFCGDGHTYFYDVIEVSDGYIVVGQSAANNMDMSGLSKASNGYVDAVIIKYNKNLDTVLWKNSFGGSNDDVFYAIEKSDNNEVVVIGYSKSSDLDMTGISKSNEGYSNAIIVKYNITNGNVISKKVFGGDNSEKFRNMIKAGNGQYIVSGSTYSSNMDLKNFNKGHSDAMLVSYDSNLNLSKIFQEPVVLIEKLKNIQPNYGSDISMNYDNIYTSNDPTKDLKGWCSSFETIGNNNYDYGQCLRPFNSDDSKMLTNIEKVGNVKQVFAGEREYLVDNEPDNKLNWNQMFFRLYNSGSVTVSNFKIKFEDGYVASIEDCVDSGYLEPLVIVSNSLYTPANHYSNPIDIIKTNGILADSTYPVFYITVKPKQHKIQSIIFTTNKDITGTQAGFAIYELRNFDMSITPTN